MQEGLTPAPTLGTARLTLSPPAAADLEEAAAMWADPAVYGPITGEPFTREDTWARLLRYVGHWHAVGYGTWYLPDTATGRFAGEVGLMDARRATEPSFEGTPEAGWALASWAHGQGLAREALEAALAWADANGIARTVCIIKPANGRSIVLAERVGYRFQEEALYRGAPISLFERCSARRGAQNLTALVALLSRSKKRRTSPAQPLLGFVSPVAKG